MNQHALMLIVVGLAAGVAAAQGRPPQIANAVFEEPFAASQDAGWAPSKGAERLSLEAAGARTGAQGLVIRSQGDECFCRQEIADPGRRPMVITGWFRADGLQIDPKADPEEYARFYIHVLHKDRPYSETSHFWVDIPPGTYDWRRLAVEIRPRHDLKPGKMWVTVAGRFRGGVLNADDLDLQRVQPYAGVDSAAWERADEAVVVSDLSVCIPKTVLSLKRRRGRWKVLDYATGAFPGKCLSALPKTGAPPVTLPLNLSGWYAVYLGIGNYEEGASLVKVKVTGDATYQARSHSSGQVQEVFFKCADLTKRDLQFAQQSAGYSQASVLMYVKLVPMTEAEVQALRADAEQRETKRLIATIDGFSFLYERHPTTKEELLEEFEHYRGSDFGTIWWCVSGADEVNYKSALGTINGANVDDFPREGDGYYTDSVKTFIKKGIDLTQVAVEAAHSVGAKIDISLRPAAWHAPPPYEEFFVSDFYAAHPEWRCYDRDGTPVMRMSFAVPEVRQHLLGIFREVLQARPDGVNVLYNRGMPLILWEEPFCTLFRERYGAEAKEVPEDDPRLYELRGEIMTCLLYTSPSPRD